MESATQALIFSTFGYMIQATAHPAFYTNQTHLAVADNSDAMDRLPVPSFNVVFKDIYQA